MAIEFYAASGSAFVWRVWLALEHKQLRYDLKMLSFSAGDTRKPEFVALNPRHRVPVLVDDGYVVYESTVIGEYLEDRYPERRIFPTEPKARAKARRLIAEFDGYSYPAARPLGAQLFSGKPPAEWDLVAIADAKAAVLDELAYFEGQLEGNFFLGAQPGFADYAIYPLVGSLARYERKKPELGLTTATPPKLAAWRKRVEALPYFDKTYPPHWRD